MQTVEEIARDIVRREGGFVNDPDDPGGATHYGVTLSTLTSLGRDLTGDGRVDLADLKRLSRSDAERIFIEHYFRKPRLAELPGSMQPSLFDMYVNAGTNAVKILQRLVTRMGFSASADGLVGPQTIAMVRAAEQAAPQHLADAYGIARRNYYYALADQRPASRKFARTLGGEKGGWIIRAEEFIAAKYHLTEAQHRERTAKWA